MVYFTQLYYGSWGIWVCDARSLSCQELALPNWGARKVFNLFSLFRWGQGTQTLPFSRVEEWELGEENRGTCYVEWLLLVSREEVAPHISHKWGMACHSILEEFLFTPFIHSFVHPFHSPINWSIDSFIYSYIRSLIKHLLIHSFTCLRIHSFICSFQDVY